MNRRGVGLFLLWLSCAAAWADSTNAAPRDELMFRNGDFLYGKLLGVSNEGLQWQHPDATAAIHFTLEQLDEVHFGGSEKPPAETGGCKVLLYNGDLFRGRLEACDATALTLDTPAAGLLKIPRVMLQSLAMTPTNPPIIDGITGLDGWMEVSSPSSLGGEGGHWTYRDGAFYASKPASIARDLKLPDMARIEFDLAWRGQPNLAIALYTDSLQPILLLNKENGPDFGGFYSFRLAGIVADIYPIKKRGQIPSLGSVILAPMDRADHAHFDFRVSKPQNKIVLLVDKTPVMQWTDPNGFEGEGTGIRFVETSGAIKLSNLRVTRWDGILEEKPEAAVGISDVVWLSNGQSLSGLIASMNEQSVTLRIVGGTRVIPFSTVREVDFMAPPVRPTAEGGGVCAMCAAGGSIHGQLESWSPDGVVLRSADFGRAKFNASTLGAIQFLHVEGN